MKRARNTVKVILRLILNPLPTPVGSSVSSCSLFLRWRLGWIRGLYYKLYLYSRALLLGCGFSCGRKFSVQGTLRVRGPGSLVIGNDVVIGGHTDLYTHASTALITIGDRCFLNGTRFGCEELIEVEEDCLLADVRIMDTDFHSIYRERRNTHAPVACKSVWIGRNVWIAAQCAVLKGVSIGRNSVIGFGSVVSKDIPSDTIATGNPCIAVGMVPGMSIKKTEYDSVDSPLL